MSTEALALPGMETPAAPVQVRLLNFLEQPVRAFVDAGRELWFLAKDVCDALGIANNRDALSEHPEDEKLVSAVATAGQARDMVFVSEAGLYRLIFKSRKAEAEAFKNWVCKEVLPSIRKRGYYRAKGAVGLLGEKVVKPGKGDKAGKGDQGGAGMVREIVRQDWGTLRAVQPQGGFASFELLATLRSAFPDAAPGAHDRTLFRAIRQQLQAGKLTLVSGRYHVAP